MLRKILMLAAFQSRLRHHPWTPLMQSTYRRLNIHRHRNIDATNMRRFYSNQSSSKGEDEKERDESTTNTNTTSSYFWTFVLFAAVGGAGYYGYRQYHRHKDVVKLLSDPGVLPAKLLPDLVQDPNHPRPYTLVIDLDKFLVCHLWDPRENRWRIAKRPGADLFLFYAAQFYEIVVYSSLPVGEGDVIVKKLDPFGCISHALYRGATVQTEDRATRSVVYQKDIERLNRELSKVVVMSHDARGFQGHPENFLQSAPWLGDANDQTLEETVDFLERLTWSRTKDVRSIIKLYNQSPDFPRNFDAIQSQAYEENIAKQQTRQQTSLLNFIFPKRESKQNAPSSLPALPSYWDKKRERMELRRREYAHARELMQKHLEAELAKEKAYYQEHKMSLMDLVAGGTSSPSSDTSTINNTDVVKPDTKVEQ